MRSVGREPSWEIPVSSRLDEAQALFWRAITWPTGIDDFLQQADAHTRAAFEATFAETATFSRNERMRVYAEAYFWRLALLLEDQFGLTRWLLGRDRFHNLVTDYVLARPPRDPDLRLFGRTLPGFLADHPEARRRPGIEDVAGIEWAILESVNAADDPPFDATGLATIPVPQWPSLRFRPTRATRLLSSRLPFGDLWKLREADASPPPPDADPGDPGWFLVWRENHEVFHRRLDPPEARALQALLSGETFDDICNAPTGPQADAATPSTVAAWLHKWVRAGLIAGIDR